MTQTPEDPNQPKEEIPAFKISPKKVDESWKDEIRRERELAQSSAAPKTVAPAGKASEAETKSPRATGSASAKQPEAGAQPQASAAEQQQSKIFMTFLAGLAQQALMQMGEMENPYSGQAEVDLQGARYTIEILATIQAKTKNNLSPDESRALNEAIRDLKMRYLEIAQAMQREMQKAAQAGPKRPGPGGSIPGLGGMK